MRTENTKTAEDTVEAGLTLTEEYERFRADARGVSLEYKIQCYQSGDAPNNYGRYLKVVAGLETFVDALKSEADQERIDLYVHQLRHLFAHARYLRSKLPELDDEGARGRLDRELEQRSIEKEVAVQLLFKHCRGMLDRNVLRRLLTQPKEFRDRIINAVRSKDPEAALLKPFLDAEDGVDELEHIAPIELGEPERLGLLATSLAAPVSREEHEE